MNLLGDLLLLPITGPFRGLKAVLEALRDEAEATQLDASKARAALSDLEMRRDLGEISEEEYEEQESILLSQLNDILADEEERRREQRPRTVQGEVVDDVVGPVVGEVIGIESSNGGSGYVEYVDGEYEEYDDEDGDYVDEEDDGAEPGEVGGS